MSPKKQSARDDAHKATSKSSGIDPKPGSSSSTSPTPVEPTDDAYPALKWLVRPHGYSDLQLLGLCAGYQVRDHNGQCVALFQEHRQAIPVIWAALRDGVYPRPPFLFRLDAHADRAALNYEFGDIAKRLVTVEDAILFADSLGNDDGDWVDAAVMLDFASGVACAFLQDGEDEEEETHDYRGNAHQMIQFSGVATRFHRAITTSPESRTPSDSMLAALYSAAKTFRPGKQPDDALPPLWIDIDLDFATMDVRRVGNQPWPLDRFHQEFRVPIVENELTVGDLLAALLKRASLITIATEPEFCGGLAGSAAILSNLGIALGDNGQYFDWF